MLPCGIKVKSIILLPPLLRRGTFLKFEKLISLVALVTVDYLPLFLAYYYPLNTSSFQNLWLTIACYRVPTLSRSISWQSDIFSRVSGTGFWFNFRYVLWSSSSVKTNIDRPSWHLRSKNNPPPNATHLYYMYK